MPKKKKILLLIETSRTYGRRLIEGVNRFALETGEWILHFEDRGVLEKSPAWIRKWTGDGVISRSSDIDLKKFLSRTGIPHVELLGDGTASKCEIYTDPTVVGRTAMEHFYERKLKRVAFFSQGQSWWSRETMNSFRKSACDLGCECDICPVADSENKPSMPLDMADAEIDVVMNWLKSIVRPIGIFCSTDGNAALILRLCHLMGLDVPNEIAVLGFENNTILCTTATPSISSLIPDGRRIGYHAAERLKAKMEGCDVLQAPVLISPLGVAVRQSTDMLAVNDPLTVRAVRYIQDNVSSQLSVASLAEELDVSSRTLARRFKEHYGKTPEEYILHRRIATARKYLAQSELPVEEIALKVGYLSIDYFARLFKKKTGLSPNRYRTVFGENK